MKVERYPSQGKQDWHFHEWSDGGCKSLLRVDAVDCDADGDGQFLEGAQD